MTFQEDGFIVYKDFWPNELLDQWEKTIVGFYYLQALKIVKLRENFSKGLDPTNYNTLTDLDTVLKILETEDKDAAFHASTMIENSVAQKKLLSYEPLTKICSELLGCSESLLTFSAGQPFINIPGTKRLLYKWHSESSYYPKRKNFLNIWFPIFRNKSKTNGTMVFAKGSHKKPYWDFLEYKNEKGRTQYEILESELSDYEKIVVEANRGDLVVFDRNLVHTSTENESDVISYTTVLRVSEYRHDLTLSSLMESRPYTNDFSRPGIEPI